MIRRVESSFWFLSSNFTIQPISIVELIGKTKIARSIHHNPFNCATNILNSVTIIIRLETWCNIYTQIFRTNESCKSWIIFKEILNVFPVKSCKGAVYEFLFLIYLTLNYCFIFIYLNMQNRCYVIYFMIIDNINCIIVILLFLILDDIS